MGARVSDDEEGTTIVVARKGRRWRGQDGNRDGEASRDNGGREWQGWSGGAVPLPLAGQMAALMDCEHDLLVFFLSGRINPPQNFFKIKLPPLTLLAVAYPVG